ncbi:MAG: aldehyde dehydrogenase family protein [Candidatus Polarisedimenticolia bacterium]
MSLGHVPILRAGRPYRSLERVVLRDVRNGEPVAEVSQANRGLIARDLAGMDARAQSLREMTAADLGAISARAADLYARAELPLDDGTTQSPDQYLAQLSATTGMPLALCRGNMGKIESVLRRVTSVVEGWTRGIDPAVLDRGWVMEGGRRVSFRAEAAALGAVLPNNSPGVHGLWAPALALKYPLVLRPGRQEPWTPLRIVRAMMAAGAPESAFSFYPSDHSGGIEVLLRCGRSMVFGDEGTLRPWKDDPRVQLHGPGWSKVILDEAACAEFEKHLDVIVASIADNGGRSCLNTSGVFVASRGRVIAEALAERLAAIEPLPMDDPKARLAAFAEPAVAHRVSAHIDSLLQAPGAVDLSARTRGICRIEQVDGCTFLRPTVVHCEDPDHPLARAEYLFPFAAVVEVPEDDLAARIGPTLVATAIVSDGPLRRALAGSTSIDRLNLGPIPTSRIDWDQPHEGNLFDHLYRRRAVQIDDAAA